MVELKSNNIILLGYPGAGKTTLGEKLADLLGFDFLDLDHNFAKTHKMGVKTYVMCYGMASFRAQETYLLQTLRSKPSRLIACGGGVVDDEKNIVYLKNLGTLIFLDLTYPQILLRLQQRGRLPEFVNEKHYRLRRERYLQAAEYIYPVLGESIEQEAEGLWQYLRGKIDGI